MNKKTISNKLNNLETIVIEELGLYNSDTVNFCKAIDLFSKKLETVKGFQELFTENDFKLAEKRIKKWIKAIKNN